MNTENKETENSESILPKETQDAISKAPAEKENAMANPVDKETAEANDPKGKSKKENKTDAKKDAPKTTGKVKVRFLASPLNRFRLAYSPGDEVKIDALQAEELVDAGYASKI